MKASEAPMKSLADNTLLSKIPCEFNFDGGKLSSDAGCLLFADFMGRMAFDKMIRSVWESYFVQSTCRHSSADVLVQKIFLHIAGYHTDDASDHLATDPAFQLMMGKKRLASQPTVSRFNSKLNKLTLNILRRIQQFIRMTAYSVDRPSSVMLDIDTTILATYGSQEGGEYIHHYGAVGYHPVVVYDSNTGDIIRAELRHGSQYCGADADKFLEPVLDEYNVQYPDTKITVRGDSGFAMPALYNLVEKYPQAGYVIRLKNNSTLLEKITQASSSLLEQAASSHTDKTLVSYGEFRYKAGSWPKERRIAYKLTKKTDELFVVPMFIVTTEESLTPKEVVDLYCKRGSMENLIKESKNSFGFRHMRSHTFIVNDNLLQISAIAHNLFNLFHRLCLCKNWRTMQADTIRLRLLKIAGRMIKHGRKIKISLASGCHYQEVFYKALERIRTMRQISLANIDNALKRPYEQPVRSA